MSIVHSSVPAPDSPPPCVSFTVQNIFQRTSNFIFLPAQQFFLSLSFSLIFPTARFLLRVFLPSFFYAFRAVIPKGTDDLCFHNAHTWRRFFFLFFCHFLSPVSSLRPKRAASRPEWVDLRPERAEFRPERA